MDVVEGESHLVRVLLKPGLDLSLVADIVTDFRVMLSGLGLDTDVSYSLYGWLLAGFDVNVFESFDSLIDSADRVSNRRWVSGAGFVDSLKEKIPATAMDAFVFGASRNPRVVSGEWRLSEIFSTKPGGLLLAAGGFDLSDNLLLDLARSDRETIRWGVAQRPELPFNIVKTLLESAYAGDSVTWELQHNVSVPEKVRVVLGLLEPGVAVSKTIKQIYDTLV